MNRNRRNIAITLVVLAGFLVAGQAAAQQNRNSGAGKKSQQSQNTKKEPGTQQPQQSQEKQAPPKSSENQSPPKRTEQEKSKTGQVEKGTSTQKTTPPVNSGRQKTNAADAKTGSATKPTAPPPRNQIPPTVPSRQSQQTKPVDQMQKRPGSTQGEVDSNLGSRERLPGEGDRKTADVPTAPGKVAATPGQNPNTRNDDSDTALSDPLPVLKTNRTVIQVIGEEAFAESGWPDEVRDVEMEAFLKQGTLKLVRDKFGIPKEATKEMPVEQMLDIVGQLALFDAEDQIGNEKFWTAVGQNGLDSALGPVVREKLELPDGVRGNAPASKILDDAGQLQTLGMDLKSPGNWSLLNDFQNGKITNEQFVDAVGKQENGGPGSRVGTVGGRNRVGNDSNAPPGTDGPDTTGFGGTAPGSGNQSDKTKPANELGGRAATPPGSSSTGGAPGNRGGTGGPDGNSGTTPPGSRSSGNGPPGSTESGKSEQNSGGPSSSGYGGGIGGANNNENADDDDGLQVEAVLGAGSYVVVTHNDDGSYTASVITSDGNGNNSVVQSETFTDSDGDGSYDGDKGGESSAKPQQGMYEGEESDEGTTFTYETESSSSSDTSDTSSGDTDSSDSESEEDVDTSNVDEFQPGPNGEVDLSMAQKISMMRFLLQALSDTKYNAGNGGRDSTPNPMNEAIGSGEVPYDIRNTVVRPVDSTGTTVGAVPAEAIQQIQDPIGGQGGVINPVKNKDQQ